MRVKMASDLGRDILKEAAVYGGAGRMKQLIERVRGLATSEKMALLDRYIQKVKKPQRSKILKDLKQRKPGSVGKRTPIYDPVLGRHTTAESGASLPIRGEHTGTLYAREVLKRLKS